jgi:hypothetical protein
MSTGALDSGAHPTAHERGRLKSLSKTRIVTVVATRHIAQEGAKKVQSVPTGSPRAGRSPLRPNNPACHGGVGRSWRGPRHCLRARRWPGRCMVGGTAVSRGLRTVHDQRRSCSERRAVESASGGRRLAQRVPFEGAQELQAGHVQESLGQLDAGRHRNPRYRSRPLPGSVSRGTRRRRIGGARPARTRRPEKPVTLRYEGSAEALPS